MASLILGWLGFTAVGPAAGSIAAAWQASIIAATGAGVPAGSSFAVLQSFAMGGASLASAAASSLGLLGWLFTCWL